MAPPLVDLPESSGDERRNDDHRRRMSGSAAMSAEETLPHPSPRQHHFKKTTSPAQHHRKRPRQTTTTRRTPSSSSSTRGVLFQPLPAPLLFTCGECSTTAGGDDAASPAPSWMLCQVIDGGNGLCEASALSSTSSTLATDDSSSSSSDSDSSAPFLPVTTTRLPSEREEEASLGSAASPLLFKTVLQVQGVCCATEVPMVRRLLRSLPYVQSLQVLVATKTVVVRHTLTTAATTSSSSDDASKGVPHLLAQILTDGGFPAQILHTQPLLSTATTTTTTPPSSSSESWKQRSDYVESLLQINDPNWLMELQRVPLPDRRWWWTTTTTTTTGSVPLPDIRVWYVSPASRTVKVEHRDTVSIHRVVEGLCDLVPHGAPQEYNEDDENDVVVILTDGASERVYLPPSSDLLLNSKSGSNMAEAPMERWHPLVQLSALVSTVNRQLPLPLSVVLSGVFWIISMVASVLEIHALERAGVVSVLFGLPPVALKAYRSAIQQRRLDANVLMVLAATGAVLLQEWEEAASVAFLFCLSEHLEQRATLRARSALQHLLHLQPPHGRVISSSASTHENIQMIPAHSIAVGSLLQVRTGDAIVTDGIVVQGQSVVDESSLTGESRPVAKSVNDAVLGGSLNVGSTPLIVRTTRLCHESAVGRLVSLVEQAQASSSGYTLTLIDGFARMYTPVVLVMAGLMATLSWVGGIELGRYWTYNALILIVIACPCALTIATPVTYAAGLAATAQRGVVVKGGGAVLETLGSVSKIMFDKTGTLTQGKFQVAHLHHVVSGTNRGEMLAVLAALESPSSHPLAVALLEATAKDDDWTQRRDVSVEDHKLVPGEGVQARVEGCLAYTGNQRMMERLGFWDGLDATYKLLVHEWTRTMGVGSSCSIGFVAVQDRGIVGLYCLTDQVRPEANHVVKSLLAEGYELALLTGDGHHAARAVAHQVGLPESAVFSHLLPEDKLHLVGSSLERSMKQQRLLASSKVMFVGDGVNDAPALATADIGVAMGDGAAVSMEMSDVTLMDSNLAKLQLVLHVGRRVKRTVRENIALSLLCKLAVVFLTLFGYMTLLYAIASDVGVMLLVTLNGMKLLPSMAEHELIATPGTDSRRRRRRMGSNNYTGVAGSAASSASTRVAEMV